VAEELARVVGVGRPEEPMALQDPIYGLHFGVARGESRSALVRLLRHAKDRLPPHDHAPNGYLQAPQSRAGLGQRQAHPSPRVRRAPVQLRLCARHPGSCFMGSTLPAFHPLTCPPPNPWNSHATMVLTPSCQDPLDGLPHTTPALGIHRASQG